MSSVLEKAIKQKRKDWKGGDGKPRKPRVRGHMEAEEAPAKKIRASACDAQEGAHV